VAEKFKMPRSIRGLGGVFITYLRVGGWGYKGRRGSQQEVRVRCMVVGWEMDRVDTIRNAKRDHKKKNSGRWHGMLGSRAGGCVDERANRGLERRQSHAREKRGF